MVKSNKEVSSATSQNVLPQGFVDNLSAPTPTNVVRTTVKIDPSVMFDTLAQEYTREFDRVGNTQLSVDTGHFIMTDIVNRYFKTLLWLRCNHVNSGNGYTQAYRRLYDKVTVPTVVYAVLNTIGEVEDMAYGMQLNPSYSPNAKDLLSPSELEDLSIKLRSLVANGLKAVTGLPRPRTGAIEVMACMLATQEVLSYRKDHPLYGFLASFFEFSGVERVIGQQIYRIRYGFIPSYQSALKDLIFTMS
jgi:hypothetical protein